MELLYPAWMGGTSVEPGAGRSGLSPKSLLGEEDAAHGSTLHLIPNRDRDKQIMIIIVVSILCTSVTFKKSYGRIYMCKNSSLHWPWEEAPSAIYAYFAVTQGDMHII